MEVFGWIRSEVGGKVRRVMTVWALDQLFVALDAKSGYSVRKTEDPASPPSNTARNLEWYFRKNGRPEHSSRPFS